MADISAKNTQFIKVVLQRRRLLAVLADICIISAVHTFMAILFTGLQPGELLSRYAVSLVIALTAYITSFAVFRIYLSLWAYADERDLVKCVLATVSASAAYLLAEAAAGLVFDYMLPLKFIFTLAMGLSSALIVSRLLYADIRKGMHRKETHPDSAAAVRKKETSCCGSRTGGDMPS